MYVLGLILPSLLHRHMNQRIIAYYKIVINWIGYVIKMLVCVPALYREQSMQNPGNIY